MTKNKFLYNNLYSSSLFYGLVVFHMHTWNKGDLDFKTILHYKRLLQEKNNNKKKERIQNGFLM